MKLGLLSLAVVSTLAMSSSVFAETVTGGKVYFKGSLTNAACAVSNDTAGQPVTLGEYRTAELKAIDEKTTPIPFSIKLVDCDNATLKTAAVAFEGARVTDTLLSVSSAGGNGTAATNVGIEISDSASNILKLDGTGFSTAKTLNNGDNELNFTARYVATGQSTAGRADAEATFYIKYE
ncbi:type 1 fimbrial major subunit FimA [Acinetobacter guillouiae]|uniref:type 1 fimbrial major subunit FimA n=1 Tax=Acinetobacter guillouiae TaxID=106649 RepID=UPI003AF605C7